MIFTAKKEIEIYGKKVEIRKIKVKEVYEIAESLGVEIQKIVSEVDVFNAGQFIMSRADFIKQFIIKYTSITADEFDDLYACDIAEILKIIIEFNGINVEAAKDFFLKLSGLAGERSGELFTEKIPSM